MGTPEDIPEDRARSYPCERASCSGSIGRARENGNVTLVIGILVILSVMHQIMKEMHLSSSLRH